MRAYALQFVHPRVLLVVLGGLGIGLIAGLNPLYFVLAAVMVSGFFSVLYYRLGWLATLAFLGLLPIFVAYSEIDPTNRLSPVKDVLLGVALAATIVDGEALARLRKSWTPIDSGVLVLMLTYLLYLPTAPSLVQGLFGFKVTLWYAFAYFLARVHVPARLSERTVTAVLLAVFGGLALWLALAGTVVFGELPLQSAGGRLLWTPSTRLHFSAALQPVALGFVYSLGLLIYARLPRRRTVELAVLVASAFVVVLAANRTAFVSIAVGSLFVGVLRFTTPSQRRRAALAACVLLVVVALGSLSAGLFESGGPLRLTTLASRLDEQATVVLPQIAAHPLGLGAGTVSGTQATGAFKDLTSPDESRTFFHGGYVSFALELGWVPGIFLLIFLSWIPIRLLLVSNGMRTPFSVLASTIAVIFALTNFANPALYQFPLNAVVWFTLGAGVSMQSEGARPDG